MKESGEGSIPAGSVTAGAELVAPWPPEVPEHGSNARTLGLLAAGMIALTIVMLGLGFALTKLDATEGLRAWDNNAARWWVEQRTPSLDSLTHVGSMLSDTITAIAVTVVAFFVLRLWLGRWYESWVLVVAIGGELLYFLVLTAVVGRARPNVVRLDAAPPTSSFPSGHTGAAVALYGLLAYLIWRYARARRVAAPAVALLLTIPLIVATSRTYRGMHFETDVISGALGGLLWLIVVIVVLMPSHTSAPLESSRDSREGVPA